MNRGIEYSPDRHDSFEGDVFYRLARSKRPNCFRGPSADGPYTDVDSIAEDLVADFATVATEKGAAA